jgi:hypothetical protein
VTRITERYKIALAALALAGLCTAVGLSKVHYALMDDQTLFLRGAEVIRDGGVLYRDLWDIKPPGIFLLYFLGGELFGFTDVGIHLFELAILVGFAVVAFLWLRFSIGPRAAWLGAFLAVLFYYAISDEGVFGNAEGWACLPAAIAGFGLLAPRSTGRLALAGLCAGLLILLKLFYGLIFAAFGLMFLIFDRDASRRVRTWVVLLISAAVPVVATVAWFAYRGALPGLYHAVFTVPYEARYIVDPMKRLDILRFGFWNFWADIRPLRLLLVPALWAACAKRHDRKMLMAFAFLVAWIGAGAIGILLQFQSWWQFHWLLILPPVALLAGFGLDWALTQLVRADAVRRAVAALFLAAAVWTFGNAVRPLASAVLKNHGAARPTPKFARYLSQIQNDARQVTCAPPETALAWMSPMIYRFSDCPPASTVEGTNMAVLPPSVRARALEDIRRSQPRYIYLKKRDISSFPYSMPGVLDRYSVEYQSQMGTWYRLRPGLY